MTNCPMCPAGMGWPMLAGWIIGGLIGVLLIALLTVLLIRLLRGDSRARS